MGVGVGVGVGVCVGVYESRTRMGVSLMHSNWPHTYRNLLREYLWEDVREDFLDDAHEYLPEFLGQGGCWE